MCNDIYIMLFVSSVALCTKWIPDMERLPVKIITKTVAFSGRSLYHPDSRVVILTVS